MNLLAIRQNWTLHGVSIERTPRPPLGHAGGRLRVFLDVFACLERLTSLVASASDDVDNAGVRHLKCTCNRVTCRHLKLRSRKVWASDRGRGCMRFADDRHWSASVCYPQWRLAHSTMLSEPSVHPEKVQFAARTSLRGSVAIDRRHQRVEYANGHLSMAGEPKYITCRLVWSRVSASVHLM